MVASVTEAKILLSVLHECQKCMNGQKIFNNNDRISLGRISLVSTFDGTTSYIKALFFRFLPEQVGRKR